MSWDFLFFGQMSWDLIYQFFFCEIVQIFNKQIVVKKSLLLGPYSIVLGENTSLKNSAYELINWRNIDWLRDYFNYFFSIVEILNQ